MRKKRALDMYDSHSYNRTDRTKEEAVDATTKTLVERLHTLQMQVDEGMREIAIIERALKIAGVRAAGADRSAIEMDYACGLPFAQMSLSDACLKVLEDFNIKDREWLTKSQIEYYLVRGGFRFAAKDSKNSVDVTLRRLAANKRCIVERVRGSKGNRYRGVVQSPRAAQLEVISTRLSPHLLEE